MVFGRLPVRPFTMRWRRDCPKLLGMVELDAGFGGTELLEEFAAGKS
jgi:hypothetical protein